MNPHHSSNQNPASTSAVQQVNPVINQQMLNGNVGGLFPNNMPVVGPPCFMNFPGQPFALPNITGQFPNGIGGFIPQQNFNPFPVNQFNLAQQQQGQFGAYQQNVGVPSEQALVQNTIQNIYQLLQLQNSNFTQCPPGSFPMFQNQFVNVMNPQNPGFPVNQQFGISSANGSVQHANHGPPNMGQQIQGNPFVASGSVQAQQPQNLNASLINFQFPQGMGPQNHNCMTNQMFGMANSNDLMQNVDQGPPGFEDNKTNAPTNVNGGLAESQSKNFTGYKTNDASHKGSKSYKHVEQKFGIYKGNMGKADSDRILAVGTASRNSTDFEKKVPSLNYTKQEVKEWCEARKKNYPTNETILKKHKKEQTLSDVTNLEAIKRRQQLKEILAKQAELGCEVADIPPSYFSGLEKQNPIEKSYERQHKYKRGKFHNKRGTSFQDGDYITKRARPRHQKTNHQPNPNKREPSLLQKLLTRDIKRDKTHLLQVLRFITANSFLTGDSLKFPSVIVRETNVDIPSEETTCSVIKVEEEEEGEIID
ncbi:hypothetical protein QVD17_09093 [Tagetes erecta]|uniref:FMR1-interacting protein 1 conserved domain-containing protein n=1 Tax=Tagetes erecta TaxID=13708 RepID=A0AAD8KYQ3_TARER|nr:hypothetical protein QVD17_09093 [Tagetes erecta]